MKISRGNLEKLFGLLNIPLPDADRRILMQPAVAGVLKKDVAEATRQGSRAVVDELRAQTFTWELDLNKIGVPVQLYHGSADTIVPPAMADYLAEHIPNATLHWVENGGHFIALELVGKVLRGL
ncbi:alpha/beta hydrolase [candidate division KSB1 bacterium]|nr:alpha/beta hydrolase [candidate division KSB1 bacterium]